MTTPSRFAARIALQRALLFWEDLWPRLFGPLMVLGSAYAVIVSGLLLPLPQTWRVLVLAVMAAAFVWTLRAVRGLGMPSRQRAMARLEAHAGLTHQPLQSLGDHPAGAAADHPLWTEHRRRQEARLSRLPLSPPRSAWRSFDPRALRVPVALAVVAATVLAPQTPLASLKEALTLTPAAAVATGTALEAWLTPPAYTGKPPILLTRRGEEPAAARPIVVPEGSLFQLRLGNARAPQLHFLAADAAGAEAPPADLKASLANGLYSASASITRPVSLLLEDGKTRLRWQLDTLPDLAPVITLGDKPVVEPLGALGLPFEARDDYGLTGITADIALADEQADGPGFASNGIFIFEPPEFPVKLSKPQSRTEKATATNDLTSHPWAGFRVIVTLTARDAAGHETPSAPLTLDLPERPFTKLMARAVMEQRKRLILDGGQAGDVAALLRALVTYPRGQVEHLGDLLMLAAIATRLEQVEDPDQVATSVVDLWAVALALEEGRLAEPRAALEAARRALEQALAEGAPPEKLQALMKNLRAAMQRYLKALGEQSRDAAAAPGDSKAVTDQDLQKMLDNIEKLSRSGATDQARQMLSELDRLMRNLQAGKSGGDVQAMRQLNELTDILRQQQKLMDDTQGQSGSGDGNEGAPESDGDAPGMGEPGAPGAKGEQGMGTPDHGAGQGQPEGSGPSLSQRQGDLGDRTGAFGRRLGPAGPEGLGQAEDHMKDARKALGEGDREGALAAQGKALQALRQALQGMARDLLQQGPGQTSTGRDPLGRGRDGNGRNPATDLKLPSEQAMQRARELLELLRQRSAEPGLSPVERDYIDRLLKGLY